MSKTIMSINFEDDEVITLSINRERFARGVTDPESFKKLMNEIRDIIFISSHFDNDVGMKEVTV